MSNFPAVDRSFSWLGRFPLAVELADTVRIVKGKALDLLDDEAALDRWIDAESSRFPHAHAARGHLDEVRRLRDAVKGLLAAHTSDLHLPNADLGYINDISASSPSFPTLTPAGDRKTVETNHEAYERFAAEVARSTIDIVSADPESLARCGAPQCGMFFVPLNSRQRWCSPACGNRARVARHAAKSRKNQRT
ncbi:MAG TPA: CGNR zinc finger domain-containing protein [Acidimicrobiia bacterium]|jgi:predicted RNA-binding Zn ribbon-like protein|nr:CGNR zinc finger domain-containing protein [Acidimicrobiia bacterium]